MKNKKSKNNWHTNKKESEEGKVKEREDKDWRKCKELRIYKREKKTEVKKDKRKWWKRFSKEKRK